MSQDLDLEPQEPVFFVIVVAFAAIAGFLGFLLGTAFPQASSEFSPVIPITQTNPTNPQAGIGPWGVFGGIKKEPC